MRYAALIPACAALILAGCDSNYHANAQIGSTQALLTNADLRLVTDRAVPDGDPTRRAVCTEPPPDIAKALSTAQDVSAKAATAAGASGGLTVSNQTAEQAMELAGRVPGVVGLRDGTYRLCEAWSNGAVGDSAYALSLSRYGELLVTLILADAVKGSTHAPSILTASLPSEQGGNGTNNSGNSGDKTDKTKPSTTGAVAADGIKLASLDWPLLATNAAPVTTPSGSTTGQSSPTGTTTPPATTATKPTTSKPGGSTTTGGTGNSDAGTAAAANAIEQMQENYLTLGAAGPLIAACIAANDPTTPNIKENLLLSPPFCQALLSKLADVIQVSTQNAAQRRSAASTTTHR
jgi:hypothetical protein